MPVALLPPLTTGAPWPPFGRPSPEPVWEWAAWTRTRNMGRWHRVRSAVILPPLGDLLPERTCLHLWCGPAISDAAQALSTDEPPEPDPLCGTCEGRAVGAGQVPGDPRLVYLPRRLTPPKKCPGSRSLRLADESVPGRGARCTVCGEHVRMSAGGSVYASTYGMQVHPPGPGLVDPCPLHAWRHLAPGNPPRCTCGRTTERTA